MRLKRRLPLLWTSPVSLLETSVGASNAARKLQVEQGKQSRRNFGMPEQAFDPPIKLAA